MKDRFFAIFRASALDAQAGADFAPVHAAQPDGRESGFTLLEMLVAAALMVFLLSSLAAITARWMPAWKAGFALAQRADLIGLGLDRIAADLAAAEYISPGGQVKSLLFKGEEKSVTFVRSAIGPNAQAGLEIVRLAEVEDERGIVLVRSRAPFVPGISLDDLDSDAVEFTNPVVLMRPPLRISFAFAGPDRSWREIWTNGLQLPNAIRITVRKAGTDAVLPSSTATLINVNAPAEAARGPQAPGQQPPAPGQPSAPGQPPAPGAPGTPDQSPFPDQFPVGG